MPVPIGHAPSFRLAALLRLAAASAVVGAPIIAFAVDPNDVAAAASAASEPAASERRPAAAEPRRWSDYALPAFE
ncbi:MAG TPA: hypothetical protein VII31_04465, partial [Caldimonas sp.]